MSALISTADLDRLLTTSPRTTVIIDARWVMGGASQRPAYLAAHLPGAHHVDVEAELSGVAGPHGRHPLPTPVSVQAVVNRCGINPDSTVIVYDDQNSLPAARVWWTLRYFGVADVRVLDGGWAAWTRADLPTESGIPAPGRGTLAVSPGHLPILDAAGAAKTAMEGVLLDARTLERFRGEHEPIDKVAGHIPGAVNTPMADTLDSQGRLRPASELRSYFAEHGGGPAKPIGTTCGSDITAAHTALALTEAGFDAAVYIGSWSDWITDPTRPVATGA
ncbi:sulfurtransferase [Kribbia dieselivorans]|uniref:sulfurtransferase n=1 Tax=Kribbia dieselivorans TaxID=331526 RepID=UPI00083959DF|nr:sulfurtransferase [Kribbia dieselivorans]